MGLGEAGGGQKRREKYTDDAHKKNAAKQAKWRRANPDKYEAYKERMRLQSRMNKGLHKPGGWLLWEIVNETGEITSITIRHHLRPAPEGGRLSDFLPHSPVDYWLARALRDARLQQLAEWGAES